MPNKITISKEQISFISEIKERVRTAQYDAMKSVNTTLINLYWDIGKSLSDKQKESWGKSVVSTLSKELQEEFPGSSGFSEANLWLMAQFYNEYNSNEILEPLVREISWSKNIAIMKKCKDDQERRFYILTTKKYGWTKNVLTHQIENKSYEKYLLNQTNYDDVLPDHLKNQAVLSVKDQYNFELLDLADEHSERELETSIIKNIRAFLMQMGNDFTFIGNQYRVEVDGKEYFIDLLLYHRQLKSLIAVELKIGDFKPEYKGKMEFYLSVLNDKIKHPDENDAIGIIICKSKSRTIVEYSLKSSTMPIGVSTYGLTAKLPPEYKNLLPSPEEINEKINRID
ncbi:MAG: PDDEXK nuclease domain-containing protein [Candidatus Delongbacteria bacterium]|jgi:predicted nuclease of restriction endonuclease-like (RecB) superfamily|nr:PDDEXK nuclease domain-containing protein [Candidatus Delongbacteria bacterium]